MDNETKGGGHKEWTVCGDPALLRVEVTEPEGGWISVTLESDPKDVVGIGMRDEYDTSLAEEPDQVWRVSLKLRLEEIPHVIAILNEVYLANHDQAIQSLVLDESGDWGERRVGFRHQTMTFPLGSREEPESIAEDLKDRTAILQDYRFLAEQFSDSAQRLGLLRPIG